MRDRISGSSSAEAEGWVRLDAGEDGLVGWWVVGGGWGFGGGERLGVAVGGGGLGGAGAERALVWDATRKLGCRPVGSEKVSCVYSTYFTQLCNSLRFMYWITHTKEKGTK